MLPVNTLISFFYYVLNVSAYVVYFQIQRPPVQTSNGQQSTSSMAQVHLAQLEDIAMMLRHSMATRNFSGGDNLWRSGNT